MAKTKIEEKEEENIPHPSHDDQNHDNHTHRHGRMYKEIWYKKVWRPCMAAVYAAIVIFDFIIMPLTMEIFNESIDNMAAVELVLKFEDPTVRVQALETFTEKRSWTALTLMGGGMFHIAFGALLTGAAVTRGLEKRQHANHGRVMN